MMQLVEEGKLSLNARLSEFAPHSFPIDPKIADLLRHTSVLAFTPISANMRRGARNLYQRMSFIDLCAQLCNQLIHSDFNITMETTCC